LVQQQKQGPGSVIIAGLTVISTQTDDIVPRRQLGGNYEVPLLDQLLAGPPPWRRISPIEGLKLKPAHHLAGFVFDYYNDNDFKFAAVNSADNTVAIGHFQNKTWTVDTSVSRTINADTSYELGISLAGTKVSITLDGQTVTSHTYNALINDGAVGLLAKDGVSLFDTMTVWGDDQDYEIYEHTATEAEALGFNLAEIANLYNPTFEITWIVDEEEE